MLDIAQRTLTALCPQQTDRATSLTAGFTVPDMPGWTGFWLSGPDDWTPLEHGLLASKNPYLDPSLLAYLHQKPPGVETGLLLLRNRSGDELVVTVQFLTFRANEQIQLDAYSKRGWRKRWARWLHFEVLAVGQFLTTGPFAVANISGSAYPDSLLPRAAEALARHLRGTGRRLHAVLLKDLVRQDSPDVPTWRSSGYQPLPVQPSMELVLPQSWDRPDDYLAALTSKYRVRYRRARKKAKAIRCRQLVREDLLRLRQEMYSLYRAIATDAGFNAVILPQDYFLQLSDRLGGRFQVYGYFQQERLVGFRTELAGPQRRLFAHFIGFDPEVNRPTQLYQNMLYDLLESAIYNDFRTLDYGRTALEIKSSVGAEPVEYFCGLKSLIPGLNWLIPSVARFLSPLPEWQPRSPFREGDEES